MNTSRNAPRALPRFAFRAVPVLVLVLAASAGAHPHVFFDQELTVHFGTGPECRVEVTLHPTEMTDLAMFREGDLNGDGLVSLPDLAIMANEWLETNGN